VGDAELYFDESGTHREAKLMTVAGYWFDAAQAGRFSRDWRKELDKIGISFAHMTDCALGYGEYKNLTLHQRIESEKRLIENIKRRTRFGFAVTIDPHLYARKMFGIAGALTCYSLCLMTLVNHIANFASVNGFKGRLNYIFEAGHASAKEANRYLEAIPAHGQAWVDITRYGSHRFEDKRSALPLQAADMLAWQTRHYLERRLAGHPKPRKDFVALVRRFDLTVEYDENALDALRDSFVELAPHVAVGDNAGSALAAARIFDRYNLSLRTPPRFKI
jgi:hypothetical protein